MPTTATFSDSVQSQPSQLEVCLRAIRSSLANAEIVGWIPGDTVGIVAMGASSNSAHAMVAALASVGRRGISLIASDLVSNPAGFDPADHYLVVSESGRSPETVDAARRLMPGRRLGITNHPDAQIGDVVDWVIALGGVQDSPVYTIGYIATLAAYALVLDHLGVLAIEPDVERLPEIVAEAIAGFADAAAVVGDILLASSTVDVIGRGASLAAATESALMFREALRMPSAAFDTYQYLHGPMESVTAGGTLLIFGDGRELSVPDSVLGSGVRVVLITMAAVVPADGHPDLTVVRIDPDLSLFARAVVEVVIVQLAIEHAARSLPFDVETFRFEQTDTKLSEDAPAI